MAKASISFGIVMTFVVATTNVSYLWMWVAAMLIVIGLVAVILSTVISARKTKRIVESLEIILTPSPKIQTQYKHYMYKQKGGGRIINIIALTESQAERLLKEELQKNPIDSTRGNSITNFYLEDEGTSN